MKYLIEKFISFTVVALFIFIGVTWGLMYEMETIPKNAKIIVYPSRGMWAPDSSFMREDFRQQLADPQKRESARRWMNDGVNAEYSDVKKGGKYENYKTFPVLLEEPGNINRGWHGPLFVSWFIKRNRWNADGSWNY